MLTSAGYADNSGNPKDKGSILSLFGINRLSEDETQLTFKKFKFQ